MGGGAEVVFHEWLAEIEEYPRMYPANKAGPKARKEKAARAKSSDAIDERTEKADTSRLPS